MPSTAGPTPKTTAKRGGRHEEPRKKTTVEKHQPEEGKQGLSVHTLNAPLRVPYFTAGDMKANARAATSWMPPMPSMQRMPPVKDLVFYGGLGAFAVVGVLEWPVALAIGGSTMLLRSSQHEGQEQGQGQSSQKSRKETESTDGSRDLTGRGD